MLQRPFSQRKAAIGGPVGLRLQRTQNCKSSFIPRFSRRRVAFSERRRFESSAGTVSQIAALVRFEPSDLRMKRYGSNSGNGGGARIRCDGSLIEPLLARRPVSGQRVSAADGLRWLEHVAETDRRAAPICVPVHPEFADAAGELGMELTEADLEAKAIYLWLSPERDVLHRYVSPALRRDVERCQGDGRSLVLLRMSFRLAGGGSHANALVVDAVRRTVTRFDPAVDPRHYDAMHGSIDLFMEALVAEAFPGYRYVSPIETSPRAGPQVVERPAHGDGDIGYCTVYSLLFHHLVALHPDLDPTCIVTAMSDGGAEAVRDRVLRYLAAVNEWLARQTD